MRESTNAIGKFDANPNDGWIAKVWRGQGNALISGFYKIFPNRQEALGLVKTNFKEIGLQGGAIFLGEVIVETISFEQLEKIAETDSLLPEPKAPSFEVIYIPVIPWPRTLELLDIFDFANFEVKRECSALYVREETKKLLETIYDLEKFTITSLNKACLNCEFFGQVEERKLNEIAETVLAFDARFYLFQVPVSEWQEVFKEMNGFLLGPK